MTTLVYAGFNLVAALVSYPAGFLSDRWGRKTILLGSCVVFLVVYAGFSLAENIVALIAFFVLYGFYQGSFRSMTRGIASDLAPEQLRASGIGWVSATIGLSQLVAGVIAGVLWDQVGHTSAFIYGMTSAAAGILGIVFLVRPTTPR
jgi:MFS family permease